MAREIASVSFRAELNGTGLVAEATKDGAEAGLAGSKAFNTTFNKHTKLGFTRLGDTMGRELRKIGKDGGGYLMLGMSDGIRKHRNVFTKKVTSPFDRLFNKLGRMTVVDKEVTRATNKMGESFKRASGHSQSFWHRLSANTRQWTLIVAAIAAAGSDIAVLGSAAGSSLVVLGTAAGALVPVFAVLYAGFKGILGPLDKMPAAVRPAAAAIQGLKKGLTDMKLPIQVALFKGLSGVINHLGKTVMPVLRKGLVSTAGTLNTFLKELAGSLSSKHSLENLTKLLKGFQPIIRDMLKGTLELGGAMTNIFVAALPYSQKFAKAFEKVFGDFDKWTKSLKGQNALATFFKHGEDVMGHVIKLFVAAGKAVADLVTPQAIKNLDELLDAASGFMPVLSKMLDALGNLDIFGLLGSLLTDLGKIITPLLPTISKLAALFSGVLASALSGAADLLAGLVGPLKDTGDPLSKMLKAVGDLADSIGTNLQPLMKPLGKAFLDIVDALAPLVTDLVNAASEGVGPLADAIKPLIKPAGDFAVALVGIADALVTNKPLLKTVVGFFVAWQAIKFETMFATLTAGLITSTGAMLGFDVAADANPIGLIVLGIEALIAAVVAIIVYWPQIQQLFVSIGAIISSFILTTFAGLTGWVGDVINLFSTFVARTYGMFHDFVTNTYGMFHDFVTNTIGMFRDFINHIVNFFKNLPAKIVNAIGTIATKIRNVFAPAVGFVGDVVTGVVDFFRKLPGRIGHALGNVGHFIGNLFNDVTKSVSRVVNGIVDFFKNLPHRIMSALGNIGKRIGDALGNVGKFFSAPFTATGGLFVTPQMRTIAEAGPEMVVPLNRPLSQVDPAVRQLSAIAQGLTPGDTKPGKSFVQNVQEGAIQLISNSANGGYLAKLLLDNIAVAMPHPGG